MTDFPINVVIDPSRARQGAADVERQLGGIESKANRAGQAIRRALAFLGGATLIREFVRLTDTFTNLQNRLRLVTRGQENLSAVTQKLGEIANKTRSSFEATVTLYARTALATKNLGRTQQETLQFTKSLNQAVILSGSSAQEANAGIIQLSQGLASGALRGDELRSVLENLPFVADVIAKSMNITRGELRLMGEQGQITAGVILKAFREAEGELDERFSKSVITIGQAFTKLRNKVTQYTGAADKANGITAKFARVIVFASENIDTMVRSVISLATVLLVNYAQTAVSAAIKATIALTRAIKRNPFGALLTALTVVIGAFVGFGDQLTVSKDSFVTWSDRVQATIEVVGNRFNKFFKTLKANFEELSKSLTGIFKSVFDFIAGLFDPIIKSLGGTVGPILDDIIKVENRIAAARIAAQKPEVTPVIEEPGIEGPTAVPFVPPLLDTPEPPDFEISQSLQQLARENLILLERTNEERAIQEAFFIREDELGAKLFEAQQRDVASLVIRNRELNAQAVILGNLRGAREQATFQLTQLNELNERATLSTEELATAQRNIQLQILAGSRDILSGTLRGLILVEERLTNFAALAQSTVTRAFGNMTDAIIDFAKTGQLSFANFITSIMEDLLRLIIRLEITIPLAQKLKEAMSGTSSPSGSGGSGLLGGIIKAGIGIFSGGAGGIPVDSGTALEEFAHGGRFLVGGQGGTDNETVAFKATRDEEVIIRTPQQQKKEAESKGDIVIQLNIQTGVSQTVQAEILNLLPFIKAEVTEAVIDGKQRGDFGGALG